MIQVTYTELDGPSGLNLRLEAKGHAGYAPAGQDIVCAGASTLMQDEPDSPRLAVVAAAPQEAWVEGAFEFAKTGFALLAERYPEHVQFMDRSRRGEQSMMDLQLFAEGGEGSTAPAAPPALSYAQQQQAIASGTMKADEAKQEVRQDTEPPASPDPPKPAPAERREPPLPHLPPRGQNLVQDLHARWAAEEAMLRCAVPDFSLKQELQNPEMRRLMQLPGMRMGDAYRLAHYNDALRQTAQTVERGVVERIQQRAARPAENGTRPGGAAVTHVDVEKMSRAQREALERQALHGATISF